MDEIDAQIEAARAELAALRAEPEPSVGRQLAFDIPAGIATAGAGLVDVLSLPFTAAARGLGADPETTRYFALTKELQSAKEALAAKAGVEADTGTQELISFLTPSPLSKAKLFSQAGTGLASYLGMQGAEAIAPDSQYAGLVGALAAPAAVSGVTKLAGAGVKAVSPVVGIAAGSDEALQAAAQAEVLRQAGTEGAERLRLAQQMPELATGTGGVPLTAAEIVQTPTLAQYQQEIAKKAGATDILGAARETRGVELQAALERLGVTPEAGDFATALRDAAEEGAKKKAASEGNILRSLGLTEEAAAVTKGERGAALREAITIRMEEADDLAKEAWRAVPKNTKLDIKDALNQTLAEYGQFGELAKADVSGKAERVMNKVREIVLKNNGIATVGELQDIRSAAGRAMAEASGTNPRQVSLMAALRDNIDNFGIKYFYDPSTGMKGGLPGTAATTPDLEALTKLSNAVEATRNLKQTFASGVVGDITAVRQFKPKLQTSKVIDRAIASPENAFDIINKFGRNSVEATELRLEMLSRLDKAKNPTDFLGRNKDTLKAIFGSDYAELDTFAKQKGRGTGLEQFERISDTQIPNKIFADVKQANAFIERFQGTELEQYARAKFIKTKLTKSGNAVANLDANKKIAQRLFGTDYPDLQKVLSDLELSKAPGELAKAASKGQSITSQSLTSLGAIAASRGTIELMKQAGPTPAGIFGAITGGGFGALAGAAIGAGVKKTGQARELQMDKFVAEILANPSLIKFAAAPPTEANIRKLIDIGQTLQRGGVAVEGAEVPKMAAPIEAPVDIDAAIEAAKKELEALRGAPAAPTPQPEAVKVGKQNVSIPTGEKYAPPSLVKAVIQVESAGKPKAVSSKGAAGLMQLMPATAKQLGVEDRFDPEQNVEGGSRYLQQMLDKYGKTDIALAAYNWGPGNIDKAIRQVKADGKRVTWANIMQVVKVPQETRLYVNKVLNKEQRI
jgi:soluble lytic murein transglycosylase-like protein